MLLHFECYAGPGTSLLGKALATSPTHTNQAKSSRRATMPEHVQRNADFATLLAINRGPARKIPSSERPAEREVQRRLPAELSDGTPTAAAPVSYG